MYWATGFFTGMVGHIPDLVTAFSDPMERILPMYQAANVNLGESTPLWVSLTKYFWLFIVYILGIIIGIRNLFRFKRLNSIEIIETGGLCGILIFSAICDFAFPGGTQMDRVLMYAPLFTVPIIIRFMVDFNSGSVIHSKVFDKYLLKPLKWVGKHAIVIILVVFLIMALPTFLVNNSNIDTQPIYKYELSEGDFVEANFSAKSLLFISDIETVYINVNYVPDAAMVNGPEAGTISNENGLFQDMDQLVNEFESYRGTAVFVLSERFDQAYRSILKVEPTDPAWIEFTSKISENDLIYNNGHDQIYINQPFE
jgi:hypothetical protein